MTERTVELAVVQKAYSELIQSEEAEFVGTWSGLTLNQKKLLRAISDEPAYSPYGKDFLAKYDLSVGGAQGAMKALIEKDIVEQVTEGGKKLHRVTDPVLGVWAKTA